MSSTLAQLNVWASSVETPQIERPLDPVSVTTILSPATDALTVIAENLIDDADGEEWALLSKSLQETLLYCTGIDVDLDYPEIKSRLLKFLSSGGKSALIKQFLSLCIFNFVWSRIGSSFRATARTQASFENDMETVERICQRIVASTMTTFESRHLELDPGAAERLILSIEEQLRADSPQNPATD